MRQALIACLAVAALALAGVAHATPVDDLNHGRQLYQQRDWSSASKELVALLYPTLRLADPADAVEAHVLYGACELELGDPKTAHDEFEKALVLDSERVINSLSYSEAAIKLFDDVKVELRVAKERADERRAEAARKARLAEALKNVVVVEQHSRFETFIPFGVGQYQNNQTKLALFFSISEAATLATSATIWGYLVNKYGISGTVDPNLDNPHTVRLLQQTEIVTGVAFIGLYIWGVIDANYHYKPQSRLEVDPSLLPPSILDPDPSAPKPLPKPAKTSFYLGPILVPSGAGVGLAWER